VIYADVCEPPKFASYFNQLPTNLFDLATGKGRAAARSRKRLNESPSAIWGWAGADWSNVSAMPTIR